MSLFMDLKKKKKKKELLIKRVGTRNHQKPWKPPKAPNDDAEQNLSCTCPLIAQPLDLFVLDLSYAAASHGRPCAVAELGRFLFLPFVL